MQYLPKFGDANQRAILYFKHNQCGARQYIAVITALLMAGTQVNARDEYSETPLHMAAGFGKTPRGYAEKRRAQGYGCPLVTERDSPQANAR